MTNKPKEITVPVCSKVAQHGLARCPLSELAGEAEKQIFIKGSNGEIEKYNVTEIKIHKKK